MAESTRPTSAISMKGGGYYSAHTRGAKYVIDNTASLALDALARSTVSQGPDPFTIADFGAADGGTSVDMVRKLIAGVRERAPRRPVTVTYTDLPRNDFSALFTMLQGAREDVESYLEEFAGVYAFASGTGFHRQIFANGSLDFGFSATAMHYLSAIPGPITDHVHPVGARDAQAARWRDFAMQDWETILLNRARELKPGGSLVMSNFCIDEQGRYLGNTGGVNMFDTFNALWKRLADEGVITQDEYQRTAFQQFYKNLDEYCAPLRDTTGPVYEAGLRLESAETRVLRCPYEQHFAQHGGRVEAFADSYIPTLRSWSEVVFRTGLDAQRPPEECQAIVDRFYESYRDLVIADPSGHAMDYVHIYMVVSKV
ncbi:MAG: SAM-dependent methyltransferase [Gammaproteobacteria bacterium]